MKRTGILLGVLGIVGAIALRIGGFGIKKEATFFLKYPHKTLQIGSHSLDVAIADTQPRRELGLSGIQKLSPGTGLLFKFDTPGKYSFWMKNMRFPIDMVFIDSQMRVVEVIPTISPDTYPEQFSSKKREYLYVLELGAGEAEKLGLKESQVLYLSSSDKRTK